MRLSLGGVRVQILASPSKSPAMDLWHPSSVRASEPDIVRQWAEMEGKSPTMRDELCWRCARQHMRQRNSLAHACVFVELIAVMLDVWLRIRSR